MPTYCGTFVSGCPVNCIIVVFTSFRKRELVAFLFFSLLVVCIPSGCMFALRLGVIGRFCTGTVAIPGYFVYCYTIYTYMCLADSHKLKITFNFYINIFKTSVLVGPRHAKVCRRVHYVRTVKAQIRLRIRLQTKSLDTINCRNGEQMT